MAQLVRGDATLQRRLALAELVSRMILGMMEVTGNTSIALHSRQVQTYPFGAYDLQPGPRLNIKTVLSTYGDFHVKDKTAVRTSYL